MILNLILIVLLNIIIFVIAEILYKKGIEAHITRKVTHIGGALICFIAPWLLDFQTSLLISLAFPLFLFWTKKKGTLNSVHGVDSKTFGAVLFPIGLAFCALAFWRIEVIIFQGAVLILGLSDSLACIIGRKFGKTEYNIGGKKTVEGSLVFFSITLFILLSVLFVYKESFEMNKVIFAILGTFILTITEGILGYGLDNLFLPLLGGLIIQFLII